MKILNFKKNGLVLVILATLPLSVVAQDKDNLQKHASEFKTNTDEGESIANKALIKEAIEQSTERDELRKNETMSNLTQKAHDAKVKELDAEKDRRVKQFILNNVPDSILAAGEEAINAYVMENFIEEKKQTEDPIEKIWSSTSDAVSIPIIDNGWQPTQSKPEIQIENKPTQKYDAEKEKEKEKETEEDLSKTEQEALSQLGLTEDELAKMLEDGPTDVKAKPQPKEKPEKNDMVNRSNVIIDNIDVTRVVIMGKSRFANLSLELKELRNGKQRNINKSLSKVGPGHIFEVAGSRFEILTISKNQVVIENLETQQSFKGLID